MFDDVALLTERLGRAPEGDFEVVVRNADGTPVVIRNAAFLRDGTPMPTRYWLVDPIELPANTKIEVTLEPGDPDVGPLGKAEAFALQIGLDVVPQ